MSSLLTSPTLVSYLAVACGGALGAMLRLGINTLFVRAGNPVFLATLTANLIGCFLIGVLFVVLDEKALGASLRPFLVVGLLGAMTTFSTFSLELLLLLQQGNYNTALAYLGGSVAVGLLATMLGLMSARAIFAG